MGFQRVGRGECVSIVGFPVVAVAVVLACVFDAGLTCRVLIYAAAHKISHIHIHILEPFVLRSLLCSACDIGAYTL